MSPSATLILYMLTFAWIAAGYALWLSGLYRLGLVKGPTLTMRVTMTLIALPIVIVFWLPWVLVKIVIEIAKKKRARVAP